jgi:hypothetical protein
MQTSCINDTSFDFVKLENYECEADTGFSLAEIGALCPCKKSEGQVFRFFVMWSPNLITGKEYVKHLR